VISLLMRINDVNRLRAAVEHVFFYIRAEQLGVAAILSSDLFDPRTALVNVPHRVFTSQRK
jgi:hypothetical protein